MFNILHKKLYLLRQLIYGRLGRPVSNGMIKFLFLLFLFFLAAQALAGQALAIDIAVPDIANMQGGADSGQRVAGWVSDFYKFSLIAGVFLAVGVIVWAGLRYTLAAGNPSTQSDARDQILQALLGLILLFGASLVLSTINPNLVNLKLETLNSVSVTAPAYNQDKGSYQVQDLKQVGQQIEQTYQQNNNAQIEILIKTDSDQERQNISAQCMVNTGGTKSTAVKGIKPGFYVCI